MEAFSFQAILDQAVEPDALDRFTPAATAARWAAGENCQVLMTGGFGDLVGGYDAGWTHMYARNCRWWDLLSELSVIRRSKAKGALSVAKLSVQERFPALAALGHQMQDYLLPRESRASLFHPDLLRKLMVKRRRLENSEIWLRPSVTFSNAMHWFLTGLAASTWRGDLLIEEVTGMPMYDPYADPLLVRIVCSVPWDLRHGPEGNRILLRRSVANVLPDRVRLRRTKSHYNALYSPIFREGLRCSPLITGGGRLEYMLNADWSATRDAAIIAPFPVLEATYRFAAVGAWLQTHRPIN